MSFARRGFAIVVAHVEREPQALVAGPAASHHEARHPDNIPTSMQPWSHLRHKRRLVLFHRIKPLTHLFLPNSFGLLNCGTFEDSSPSNTSGVKKLTPPTEPHSQEIAANTRALRRRDFSTNRITITIWLSAKEAAKKLSVSTDTIGRRAIEWQESPERYKVRYKYLVLDKGAEPPRSACVGELSASQFSFIRMVAESASH
ncbi:MAG: hypothetical protein HY298_14600 [Verrucomicrobia bacterium]|nr:hypothetical protein [Verrucomicrobiota bacterium]